MTPVPKIPANCIVSACLFFLGSLKYNAHALHLAAVSVGMASQQYFPVSKTLLINENIYLEY